MSETQVKIKRHINPDDPAFRDLSQLFVKGFFEKWGEEHEPAKIEEFFRWEQQRLGDNSVFMSASIPSDAGEKVFAFTRAAIIPNVVDRIWEEAAILSQIELPQQILRSRADAMREPPVISIGRAEALSTAAFDGGMRDGYFGDVVVDRPPGFRENVTPQLIVETYRQMYRENQPISLQGIFTHQSVDRLIGGFARSLGGECIYPTTDDEVSNPLKVYIANGNIVKQRISAQK